VNEDGCAALFNLSLQKHSCFKLFRLGAKDVIEHAMKIFPESDLVKKAGEKVLINLAPLVKEQGELERKVRNCGTKCKKSKEEEG
jgi:hypothetical protein